MPLLLSADADCCLTCLRNRNRAQALEHPGPALTLTLPINIGSLARLFAIFHTTPQSPLATAPPADCSIALTSARPPGEC